MVIFADDLGYGDLGCYGADYETPSLDQLAAEGLRCTDFIVPANVCSPSRAALLTGRYPMRNGHPVYRTEDKTWTYGLHPDEITFAELLDAASYQSLAVGKWHLGFEKEGSHPMDAGFDAYYGLAYNYSKKHEPWNRALYRDREVEEAEVEFEVVTERYTQEVVRFIEQHDPDAPFLIYLAHQIAHSPVLPSEAFKGATGKGVYADFVAELDHSTGQVLEALRDAGLEESTLVVFLADNGHTGRFGSGGPLAGGKYTTMEGGHRVPGIFRWKGTIPAGQVSDVTVSSMDLLPLFCDLAEVEAPKDRKIDGKNILNVLLGEAEESPHEILYYYNGHNLQAVRKGKWKLHLPRSAQDQPFWGKGGRSRRFYELDEAFLVNLETDIAEERNLAAHYPEVVTDLLEEAERARRELGDVGVQGRDQRPGWPPRHGANSL
ncbi:sulfatase-like hydrolase/transferase [Pelagicoccus sp. SDUM812005]|uniref:sulfatase-like hydrolase/transferase n=1 Tax=Pelagicoccus sp. SDUM812005 TaxID=3041257 RepID=UPI002810DDFB|nr:sulfatase-like hydrolase/transferase [Pelagicoccus sp. SDUM812005]